MNKLAFPSHLTMGRRRNSSSFSSILIWQFDTSKWHSQIVICSRWGLQDTFREPYCCNFHNYSKVLCVFLCCVGICTDGARAKVAKSFGSSALINAITSPWVLHINTLSRNKKNPISLQNVLDEFDDTVKIINFSKFQTF